MLAGSRSICTSLLIFTLAACASAQSRKPAPKKTEERPPSVEIKPVDGLFLLNSLGGLPNYLKASSDALLSLEGVNGGEVKTADADFLNKDFVFDVVVRLRDEQRREFTIGIGENGRERGAGWIFNSVCLNMRGDWGDLTTANRKTENFTRLKEAGDYLVRLEKKGTALTFTMALRTNGKFMSLATKTLADLNKGGALTSKNSTLFFSGSATVMLAGLTVDGKALDPGRQAVDPKTANAQSAEIDKTPLLPLTGQSGLPSWLRASPNVLADADGLSEGETRTTTNDYFEKDFVFDLVFKFMDDDAHDIFLVGLGENGREGGAAWILNSVFSRVHGPGHKGECTLSISKKEEKNLGSLGKNPGPHLFRLEKRGDTLTMAVCVDFKDKFEPTFSKTIPSLKQAASFLGRTNGGIFFEGNKTTRFVATRLLVDGKPVENKTVAGAIDHSAVDKARLVSLAGSAGIPPWLKANKNALAGPDGIRGGELRSTDKELALKDFVFDVVYEFKDDGAIFLAGIGENGREGGAAWILNSVCSRIHGPQHGGMAQLVLPKNQSAEPTMGKTGRSAGPHLLRIARLGNTLTFATAMDFGGDKFDVTWSKTLPDIGRAALFLNKTNGTLFLEGNNGVVFKSVRLVVGGKAVAGGTAVATTVKPDDNKTAVTPATPGDDNASPPLVSLAGQTGLPPWMKGSADALAGPDGIRGGQLRSADTTLYSKDFTFDLVYEFKPQDERSIFHVGLGENDARDGMICARVHGPGHDGMASLKLPKTGHGDEPLIGKTGKNPGPHLFRLQKKGNTLTLAICESWDGQTFKPTHSRTIPDLAAVGSFLNKTNGGLFVGGNCTFKAIGLIVDGKPVQGGSVATLKPATGAATAGHLTGPEHLIRLSGPRLPTFFKQQRDLKFQNNALLVDGKHIRTVASDYLNKDFTFDVVYRLPQEEYGPMLVGIGENGRNGGWILNSVCAKVHGQRHEGLVQLMVSKQQDAELGKFGRTADGPHMVRLQKKGNTLTIAVCPDYKNKFDPTVSRTIPDLKSIAPFLTSANSGLFISDKGIVEQVRLVIDGEAIESVDVALGTPPRIVEGQPLRQQIGKDVKGAEYAIDKAPKGLTLSAAGQLAWTPTKEQIGRHELRIKVTKNKQTVVVPGEIEVVSAADAAAVKGDLSKVAALYRLDIASEKFALVSGLGGKSMLLLDGDSLRRLDPDGITVKETVKLPAKYTLIGERPDYFVAMSDEKQALDILDKKTLAIKKSIQMVYRNRHDLALHPSKPISYATVETGKEGARDSILIVDEISGDVLEPQNFIGRWVKLSPDGRLLYAGYKDIYQKGDRLLVNPDRIHVIPEYGSIDQLYVYDITAQRPRRVAFKDEVGANGFGLSLSADGKRLSYQSFTGYPLYSKNIPAFDALNLEKRPVTYSTKEVNGDCRNLDFHPFLEIAAAPSQDGVICFNRETGEALPKLADLSYPPLGEVKAKRVFFSADGRNVLIEVDDGADRSLRKVRLNLTPEQIKKCQEGLTRPAPTPERIPTPRTTNNLPEA